MNRRMITSLAALALIPESTPAAASADRGDMPTIVQWRVTPSGSGAANFNLELRYRTATAHNLDSRRIARAALHGLDANAFDGRTHTVRFGIVRDAGSFSCEGATTRGSGAGRCRFTPAISYAVELGREGYGTPTDLQLLRLAIADIGRAYTGELHRQGYERPTVAQLVDAGDHGTDQPYVTAIGALGDRVGTLTLLIRMHDHGIDTGYINALNRAGLTGLSARELIELRDHDVTGSYIGGLRAAGYVGTNPADFVRLRDHDVSADFVRRNNGGRRRSTDDLIKLREGG